VTVELHDTKAEIANKLYRTLDKEAHLKRNAHYVGETEVVKKFYKEDCMHCRHTSTGTFVPGYKTESL